MSITPGLPAVRRFLIPGVLLLLVALGCEGGNASRAPGGADEDLTGELVRNHYPGFSVSNPSVRYEEMAVLTDSLGSTPFMFGNVRDYEFVAGSAIFVLDMQSRQVHLFDDSGRHVSSVGGRGSGPGEFRLPLGLTKAPDRSIWVVDPQNSRYVVLEPSGLFRTAFHRSISSYTVNWSGVFCSDGSLLESTTRLAPSTGERELKLLRQRVRGNELVVVDEYDLPVLEASYFQVSLQGGSRIFGIPFAPEPSWMADGEGGVWIAPADRYMFWRQELGGGRTLTVELDKPTSPIPPGVRREARLSIERSLSGIEGGVDQVDFSRIPEYLPAYGQLLLDDQGRIWIQSRVPDAVFEQRKNASEFEVFDSNGHFLGMMRLGVVMDPRPIISGNHLIGVRIDDEGAQQVILYRIILQ